jgi:hypothetical protein
MLSSMVHENVSGLQDGREALILEAISKCILEGVANKFMQHTPHLVHESSVLSPRLNRSWLVGGFCT